ncbi:hypothetical protein SEA_PHINKY_13 [Microbacterium phage Phinky]|nr:hypothetical protein SEA_PHINKY_13 [Microbacterium phage Phinky]
MTEQQDHAHWSHTAVRRRVPEDDQHYVHDPEGPLPDEYRWVTDTDWWTYGIWTGGSFEPFTTFEEALANAIEIADETRGLNRRRAAELAIEEPTA